MRKLKIRDLEMGERDLFDEKTTTVVREIIRRVREEGDEALRDYCEKFDGVRPNKFLVPKEKLKEAWEIMGSEIQESVLNSKNRLTKFAEKQKEGLVDFEFELEKGLWTGQRVVPIENIGIYVPGGRYPLVSSVLMGAVPARAAGVDKIVMVSPPDKEGNIHPYILGAAYACGIDEVYSVGGAQAIAALAYGTREIQRVDKIVGPGNRFVAAAKKEVYGRVGIDFVAGPSEVLVLASGDARPDLVAADLLAQAEHDPEAVAILVALSNDLILKVEEELKKQARVLSTKETAALSLEKNGLLLLADSYEEALCFVNSRAPEHLELHGEKAESLAGNCENFGSLFIGSSSGEVLGDYSAGINHTLPTAMSARYTGGLSVKDFLKTLTTLRADEKGAALVGKDAMVLAELEGLSAHYRAAELRTQKRKDG